MNSLDYWLWLSALEISSNAKAALLSNYGGPREIHSAPSGVFSTIRGVSKKEAQVIEDSRESDRCKKIRIACEKDSIEIIACCDSRYPDRLKNIYAYPPVLYVKGKMPYFDEEPAIAVIGTRKASAYGLNMGEKIASELVCCGAVVISGLTNGVDAAAAEAAMRAGGKCVAVLGTPHGGSSVKLAAKVLECGGTIITEYPPEMPLQRSFFRERNRIASGLSVGVVVIEAPEKSGTRLFAHEAVEQGRDVYAVPGNADDPNCAGTNALIKEGAKPVTCGWEIASEYMHLFPEKLADSSLRMQKHGVDERKKQIDNKNTRVYIDFHEKLSTLTEDQLKIITAIDKNGSFTDEIINLSGYSTSKVLAQLTMLEIKGVIRRDAGKRIYLSIT